MRFIADLHIHSRFSRATSREMEVPMLDRFCRKKGIALCATGDFTHPEYRRLLREQLEPADNGLFVHGETHFILNVEVSSIYSAGGRLRRIHNLVFVPDFETAEAFSAMLGKHGKLESDGRPTVGLSSYEMLARLLELNERAFLVPGHIWTPWFSLYGSNSGFDSIEECFGDLSEHIFAVETGLSSDPPMNWRLSALDSRTLISNSDAHSPSKLGREANVFDCELGYDAVLDTLRRKDRSRLLHTIEFFPEEGKYHYDGHRNCRIVMTPGEARQAGNICPMCGRRLTIGVLHRVEELADRAADATPDGVIPFRSLVPLEEILAEALGKGRDTKVVQDGYDLLCTELGNEFSVLLDAEPADIARVGGATDEQFGRVAEGIERMRRGEVERRPGYDGEFGIIRVLPDSARPDDDPPAGTESGQLGLF